MTTILFKVGICNSTFLIQKLGRDVLRRVSTLITVKIIERVLTMGARSRFVRHLSLVNSNLNAILLSFQ